MPSANGNASENADDGPVDSNGDDEWVGTQFEASPDREASRWGGYVLAGLLAVVFLLGLVRLTYPNVSILVIGSLLAVFGLVVGLVAVWERIRGS